jgi:4-hydroxy-2-oxoheptanedioate aldolase
MVTDWSISLRSALRSGPPIVAAFVLIPRIEIIEALAAAGFGAVILDLEHAPIAASDLPPLVAAAHGSGIRALARVGDPSVATIGRALDAGLDGVVVPHVDDADQASEAADAVRYPPEGSRSLNPYVRSAGYDAPRDYLDDANASVALLVMVEGSQGRVNLGEISKTSGVDGIFVGPVDLSAALGHPGQPEHPKVVEAVRQIIQEAPGAVAVYSPTPAAANRWLELGARLVTVSADIAMAMSGFRHFRTSVKEIPDENR